MSEQLKIDQDVHGVLEYMQEKIAASRLLSVADSLPQLAKLLWGHNPQERVRAISIEPICLGRVDDRRLNATESLDGLDAGGGSAEGEGVR